jgi:hypothetical protein
MIVRTPALALSVTLLSAGAIAQQRLPPVEQRSDLLISTLRGYVEAMGGRLSLIAEFPNQDRSS